MSLPDLLISFKKEIISESITARSGESFLQILIKISKNLNNEINNCSKDGISITFFFTPFLKKLTLTNDKNKEILGPKNVNSGFNYTCLSSGSIIIYRKEDFFKVFVHESIHGYGIDMALHNNFNQNKNYNNFLNLFALANKDNIPVLSERLPSPSLATLEYICVSETP